MVRTFFIGFALLVISIPLFSQERDSIDSKGWLFYLEGYGNGGHYSINGELSRKRAHIQTGDRFGVAYMIENRLLGYNTPTIQTKYISILYEKNIVFRPHAFLRPELGIGGTLFLLDGIQGTLDKDYYVRGNKMTFWLVPRIGFRVVNVNDFFARIAYTPAIFITELEEEGSTKFDSRFGISLGFAISSLYRK